MPSERRMNGEEYEMMIRSIHDNMLILSTNFSHHIDEHDRLRKEMISLAESHYKLKDKVLGMEAGGCDALKETRSKFGWWMLGGFTFSTIIIALFTLFLKAGG